MVEKKIIIWELADHRLIQAICYPLNPIPEPKFGEFRDFGDYDVNHIEISIIAAKPAEYFRGVHPIVRYAADLVRKQYHIDTMRRI